MAKPKRIFTREFKLEAVRLATSGEKPLVQVARELGVGANLPRGRTAKASPRSRELAPRARLPKKGGVFRQGVAMKYAAVRAHRAQFSVALMCRVLGVSRSGFYAAQKRAASARARRDDQLRGAGPHHSSGESPHLWQPARARRVAGVRRKVWPQACRSPDARGRAAGEVAPPLSPSDD